MLCLTNCHEVKLLFCGESGPSDSSIDFSTTIGLQIPRARGAKRRGVGAKRRHFYFVLFVKKG